MNGRSFLRGVRRRPALHGIDATYETTTAFMLGFDAATAGCLLSGFREWLIVRIGDGNNLSWPALAARALANECRHGKEGEICARCREQAGARLFDLVDDFLAIKEKRNGMAALFDAYLGWLKVQEWYRPDMLE